jgi:hypothetical protein
MGVIRPHQNHLQALCRTSNDFSLGNNHLNAIGELPRDFTILAENK